MKKMLNGNLLDQFDLVEEMSKKYGLDEDDKNRLYDALGMDKTTGLKNYNFLVHNLGSLIAESQREPVSDLSIYISDIDNFKKMNEAPYDKVFGNLILRKVANVCKENINRQTDFVARYGGDENVGVFPKTSKYDVQRIAENTGKAIKNTGIEFIKPVESETEKVAATASFGVGSVKDIPHIKILHSDTGKRLFIGFLDGKYSELVKDFSKETGIRDEIVDFSLRQLESLGKNYTKENKIRLTLKQMFHPEYNTSIPERTRTRTQQYMGVESFISKVDKMLQEAKGTKDKVVVLPSLS